MKYLIQYILFFGIFFQNLFVFGEARVEQFAANDNDQRSLIDRWNELRVKAMQEAGVIKDWGNPRKVGKGARPQIILSKNEIHFDGKKLVLGEPIESWKEKILAKPRCFDNGMTLCVWDEYGLEVGTGYKNLNKVQFMNIYINADHSNENVGKADYPDGRPAKPLEDNMPYRTFSGYLELNGVGIDAKTEFREVQAGSVANRTLHCGLLDCSHPSGPFGEHANISLTLDGRNERGRLLELGIDVAN